MGGATPCRARAPFGLSYNGRLVVDLSIVVPVFNCGSCLRHLHERLVATLSELGCTYELVFVDDRSEDDGWEVLTGLAAANRSLRLVRLSRNFGQHAAITAGLAESRGRFVVVMDCDLQDRPEDIPRLWEAAQKGYDVVFTERRRRAQSTFRRSASRLYAWLGRALHETNLPAGVGSFSLVSRKVCDAFLTLRERDRNYLLVLGWLGYRSTVVPVDQAPRFAGRSAYSLSSLVRFAFDGVFFQSTAVLRWIIYLGFLTSLAGVTFAVLLLVNYFSADPYPGWTRLAVLLLLVAGFIITSTGLTGLYVGRIFMQVKERPIYVVDDRVDSGAAQHAMDAAAPVRASEPAAGAGVKR